MHTLRTYLIASLVGVALAWAVVTTIGTLAAIAIPAEFFAAFKKSPVLVVLLTSTLLVQVPAILLSGMAAWGFFRLAGRTSAGVVAALALPWLIGITIWSWSSITSTELALADKLALFFSWQTLPGTLSVPLGVVVAYLAFGRQRRNARSRHETPST